MSEQKRYFKCKRMPGLSTSVPTIIKKSLSAPKKKIQDTQTENKSSTQESVKAKDMAPTPTLQRDENNGFGNIAEQKVFTNRGAIPKVLRKESGTDHNDDVSSTTSSNSNNDCFAQFVDFTGGKLETLSATPYNEIAFLREFEGYIRDTRGCHFHRPLSNPPNTPTGATSFSSIDANRACSYSGDADDKLFVSSSHVQDAEHNDQPFDSRNHRENKRIIKESEHGQRQDESRHCCCCCNCHIDSKKLSRSSEQGRQSLITTKSFSDLVDSRPFQLSDLSKPLPKKQRATGGQDKSLNNTAIGQCTTIQIDKKIPIENRSYVVKNHQSSIAKFEKILQAQENNSVKILYEPPTQEADRYFQSSRSSVCYATYSSMSTISTMHTDKADYNYSTCTFDTLSLDCKSTQEVEEVKKPLVFVITAIEPKADDKDATQLDEETIPKHGENSVTLESDNITLLSFVRDQLLAHIYGCTITFTDTDVSEIEKASKINKSAQSKESSKFIRLEMISSTDTEKFEIKSASKICQNKSTQTILECFCKQKCVQIFEKKDENIVRYEEVKNDQIDKEDNNVKKYPNDRKDKKEHNNRNDEKYHNDKREHNNRNDERYHNDKKEQNNRNDNKYHNDTNYKNENNNRNDKISKNYIKEHNNRNHKKYHYDTIVKKHQNDKQHKNRKKSKKDNNGFVFIRPQHSELSTYTSHSISQRFLWKPHDSVFNDDSSTKSLRTVSSAESFQSTPPGSVFDGDSLTESPRKSLSEEHFKRLKRTTNALFKKKSIKCLLPKVKYKMQCAMLEVSSRDPVLLRFERQQHSFFKKISRSILTELEILRGICQLIPNVDNMSEDQTTSDRYPIVDTGILYYLMRLYNARLNDDSYHMQAYMLEGYYAADMLLKQGIPTVVPPKSLVGANGDGADGACTTEDDRESAAEGGGAVKSVGASAIIDNSAKCAGESDYFSADVINKIPVHILPYLDLKLYEYINEQEQLNRNLHKTHLDVNELLCYYIISSYYRTLLQRYGRGVDTKKASFAVSVFETYILERESRCGRIKFEDLYNWIRMYEIRVIPIDLHVRNDVRLNSLKRLNNDEIVHVINMHVYRHFEHNKALPQPDVLTINEQKKPKKSRHKKHLIDDQRGAHKCPIGSCHMRLECRNYMTHFITTHTSLHEELRCEERAVHFMHPRLYPDDMQVYCISMLGFRCDAFAASELPLLNTELPPGCEDYAHLQPVNLMYCKTKKQTLDSQLTPYRKFDSNSIIYVFWLMAPNMSLPDFDVNSINCKITSYNLSLSEGATKIIRVLEHNEFDDMVTLLLKNYDDCFVIDFRQMVSLTNNFTSLFCLDIKYLRDTTK